MQTLTGLAPLVAFFVTYRWGGLYAATAVLMVTMVLVLGVDWLRERRIPPVHALSAVLVLVFGGATLLLHTALHPVEADGAAGGRAAFLQLLVGRAPCRASSAQPRGARVSAGSWRWLNAWSVCFYALAGALNLAVAHYASESAWVNFKIFGLTILTFVFTLLQVLWLTSRGTPVGVEPSAR
jgi:intracellular septation protein